MRLIQDHEEAVLIDSRTGQVLWRKVGESMRIEFDTFDIMWMLGSILTHNHPTGGRYPPSDPRSHGNSFSPADVALFVSMELAELRAVAPTRTYSLRPPDSNDLEPGAQRYRTHIQQLEFQQVMAIVTDHAYLVGRALAHRVADLDDPMTIADAEAIQDHLSVVELARSWRIRYERDEERWP